MTRKKPGAKIGRPKTLPEDVEQVHAIVSRLFAKELTAWAKSLKISRSELIRLLIEEGLRERGEDNSAEVREALRAIDKERRLRALRIR